MFLKFDYGQVFKKYLLNISFFWGVKEKNEVKSQWRWAYAYESKRKRPPTLLIGCARHPVPSSFDHPRPYQFCTILN